MASKQTRRSISVRGTTYSHLRDFCAQHDRSMSDVVEELLSRILEDGEPKARAPKTVAPLIARAPKPEPRIEPKRPVEDRAAFRVAPLPPQPAPVARVTAAPVRPVAAGPARPVPVSNAGRPAPTPAAKVEGTSRGKSASGDYRAIRF